MTIFASLECLGTTTGLVGAVLGQDSLWILGIAIGVFVAAGVVATRLQDLGADKLTAEALIALALAALLFRGAAPATVVDSFSSGLSLEMMGVVVVALLIRINRRGLTAIATLGAMGVLLALPSMTGITLELVMGLAIEVIGALVIYWAIHDYDWHWERGRFHREHSEAADRKA